MSLSFCPLDRDPYGAMKRRIVFLYFKYKIDESKVDSRLGDECFNRAAEFIVMANRCYHKWRKIIGKDSFWHKCPQRFRDDQKIINNINNPILLYLQEPIFEVDLSNDGKANYMDLDTFLQDFHKYQTARKDRSRAKITNEIIEVALQTSPRTKGCRLSIEELPWPPKSSTYQKGYFILGLSNVNVKVHDAASGAGRRSADDPAGFPGWENNRPLRSNRYDRRD
jgi:hypothetical protein